MQPIQFFKPQHIFRSCIRPTGEKSVQFEKPTIMVDRDYDQHISFSNEVEHETNGSETNGSEINENDVDEKDNSNTQQ